MKTFADFDEPQEPFDAEFPEAHSPRRCPHCGELAMFSAHPVDSAIGSDYLRCSECDRRV